MFLMNEKFYPQLLKKNVKVALFLFSRIIKVKVDNSNLEADKTNKTI